jgi:hypothetical protein
MKQLYALALALGLAAPAFATGLADMRAEDLLPLAPEFRKTLNLNANQQTLFTQVENKTRTILRERQSRRERLQQKALTGLAQANAELRDYAQALDAEATVAAGEEVQMRALWLDVNDALNETQRQAVLTLVMEQMQRVPDHGAARGPARGKEVGGAQHQRGMGGRKPPGGGPGGQ